MQMYASDKTTITLGKMQETIEVTCGIRQGCSISTLLFKMVTFCIIEELEEQGTMYEVDRYNRNSPWLADEATVIANSKESLKNNKEILKTPAKNSYEAYLKTAKYTTNTSKSLMSMRVTCW